MPTFRERLLRSLQAPAPFAHQADRFAAVAIILREHHSIPQVLLIQRAARAGDPWSGHLAFPGGRQDASDRDLEATATRETVEEVGLDLAAGSVLLGALPPLRPRLFEGLLVAPYAYWLEGSPTLALNPAEVDTAFWTDLPPLAEGAADTVFETRRGQQVMRFPGYRVNNQVLWGMTYYMLQPILTTWRDVHASP
jgi:8-oxo-dGTP pyrophosphatase MutT (NUDIX family)